MQEVINEFISTVNTIVNKKFQQFTVPDSLSQRLDTLEYHDRLRTYSYQLTTTGVNISESDLQAMGELKDRLWANPENITHPLEFAFVEDYILYESSHAPAEETFEDKLGRWFILLCTPDAEISQEDLDGMAEAYATLTDSAHEGPLTQTEEEFVQAYQQYHH